MKGRVLVVDDDRSTCEVLAERLGFRGYVVEWRTSAEQALDLLRREAFDVVVTDVQMRGMNGIALCERVATNRPDVPVVVITAFGSIESAVAAIRAGAYDFVTKPFDIEVLALSVQRALQLRGLREEVRGLRQTVAESTHFEEVLGASPPMARLYELLARALHRRSGRRGPFVAINCAAMPEALLESELFGHTKGAFTDAKEARVGLLPQADGGTLFLDEVGDMAPGMQSKLLRALQERRVRPVGGSAEVAFDARVLAATHRDLETAVEEKRFRDDLYYRLNVIKVEVPPLRARGGDVLLLAQRFLEHFARRAAKPLVAWSAPAAERLLAYAWPGNVRELQNCVERAVALTRYAQIAVEDLPEKVRTYRSAYVVVAADDPSELVPLEEVERRYILRVMEAVAGNKTAAAQVLGIERATLYRKLDRYARAGS
jgi:DNA-binding NtrC family response regulator